MYHSSTSDSSSFYLIAVNSEWSTYLRHDKLILYEALVEPEIPAEFKEGMEAIAKGETLDLDDAMPELRSE